MNHSNVSLLKIAKTIIRWPLLFLVPLVLVAITLIVSTRAVKTFRSSAIVLFQSGYIPVEEYFTLLDKFDDRPVLIIRSLLFGRPAEEIVGAVWPETKTDESARNAKIQQLRSFNGISLKFQRDNPEALAISYDAADPELAYNVVSATIKALIGYNQEITKRKIDSAVEFIEKELETSRQEIAELEQKIVRVRSGLPESVLKERDLETENIEAQLDLRKSDYELQDSLAKAMDFSQSVTELTSEIEIAQKELEQLQKDLEQKSYLDNTEDLEIVLNAAPDPEISRTTSLVLDKQQRLNELKSKGYLEAHPDIISLNREIESLRAAKKKRLLELQKASNRESPELTQLKLEKLQLKKIDNKKLEIQRLEERLAPTKAYEEKFKDKKITLDDKLRELSERKASLLELENKRVVAAHSYAQMTKRLEVIKREGRVDQTKFGLNVTVAEPPKIAKSSVPYAGLPIILLGLGITAGILFGLAAAMSYFDRSIYSSAEANKLLGVPVIGVIDSFKSVEQQKQDRIKRLAAIAIIAVYTVVVLIIYR